MRMDGVVHPYGANVEKWIANKDIDRAIDLLRALKEANNGAYSSSSETQIDFRSYKLWSELRDIVARFENCFIKIGGKQ